METSYKEGYYKQKLAAGIEYQDFVCLHLHSLGIVLQNMQSQKYQLKKENLLGLEIKFDDRFQKTGNLYIEISEKADPINKCFVPSGIYRDDGNWLYGIGDRREFFIFGKSFLRQIDSAIDKRNWPGVERKQIHTSKGFVIPGQQAIKWCLRHIIWET